MKRISSKSISIPDDLWVKIKDRSWELRKTTSAYITEVLRKEFEHSVENKETNRES